MLFTTLVSALLVTAPTLATRAQNAVLEAGARFPSLVLTLEIESRHFESGEAEVPGGPPALAAIRTDKLKLRLDGSEAERQVHISAQDGAVIDYTEQLSGCEGSRSITNKAGMLRVEPLDAVEVRAFYRSLAMFAPWLVAQIGAHAYSTKPGPTLKVDGKALPTLTVKTNDGPLTVGFDPGTGLPTIVQRSIIHPLLGPQVYEIHYTAWRTAGVLRVPKSWTIAVGGEVITYATVRDAATTRIKSESDKEPCATPPTVAEDRHQKATAGAESDLTRLLLGQGTEEPTRDWQLIPIGEGIHRLSGSVGDVLVLEMRDHLILFDAPCAGRCAAAELQLLRAAFPAKPIRTLVLSHHHDARAFGLLDVAPHVSQVAVASSARDWAEKLLQRVPKKQRPIVLDVAPQRSLTDGKRTVRLMRLIDHPHASTLIMAYVPDAKVLWAVDVDVPRGHPLHFEWNDRLSRAERSLGVAAGTKVVDGAGIGDAAYAVGERGSLKAGAFIGAATETIAFPSVGALVARRSPWSDGALSRPDARLGMLRRTVLQRLCGVLARLLSRAGFQGSMAIGARDGRRVFLEKYCDSSCAGLEI